MDNKNRQIAVALCSLFFATPLFANPALMQLLEVLRDNGTLTQAQFDQLQAAASPAAPDPLLETQSFKPQPTVGTRGGITVADYDGQFSAELGGRVMIDAAYYDQDQTNLGDGTELRRARLEMEGTLYGEWSYNFSVDAGDGDADVKNAYLTTRQLWPFELRIGHFKEPFSLEEQTSSKHLTFMERALPNALAPGRSIGVGLQYPGRNWMLQAGLFGGDFNDDVKKEGDEGRALTARLSYLPIVEDTQTLHFGVASSYRWTDDKNEIDYDSRPESHITDVKFLNTDDIEDVEHIQLWGLEAAYSNGPFSWQSEYIRSDLDRSDGLAKLEFSGWYSQLSWFITGEHRPYKSQKGSFGRITPNSPAGAWELAARISHLDLNDREVEGGESDQISLGLNWYINRQVRLMTNYLWVDNDDYADDDGDAAPSNRPNILQFRLQADFK